MPSRPIVSTLVLPRYTPAPTLVGAVHYAVTLEAEHTRSWPVFFYLNTEDNGWFALGQNSCQRAAQLHVRPQDQPYFDPAKSYSIIEVASQAAWPDIDCRCTPHTRANVGRVLDSLVRSLERVLKA